MKNLFLSAFCCLLIAQPAHSQTWCWVADIVGMGECGGLQNASVDNLGNIYAFSSGPATITVGTVTVTGSGKYLMKHKAATGALDWVVGGIGGSIWSTSVVNDARGNVYMFYDSSATQYYRLTKLDSFGNVVWSRMGSCISASGTNTVNAWNIAKDDYGHLYLSGFLRSQKLVSGTDTLLNIAPDSNSFVIKYDTMGNLIWSKLIRAPKYVYSPSIAANSQGDLFISALVNSPTLTILDTTVTLPITRSGVFVAKFDSSKHLQWITANNRTNTWYSALFIFLEGSMNIVAADDAGNAYLGGTYQENDTLGTLPVAFDASHDKYIAKYRNTDGQVMWARTGGNAGSRGLYCFTSNAAGHTYGIFESNSSTSLFGDSTFTYTGGGPNADDVTIVSVDSNGKVVCGYILGGFSGDDACGIAVDKAGYDYIVGDYEGTTTFGDTTLTSPVERYFVSKYSCHCSCTTGPIVAPTSVTISVSPSDTVCVDSAVTLTATLSGSGTTPGYQWVVNGVYVGPDDSVFTYVPGEGDSVRCIVINDDPCAINYSLSSNTIILHHVIPEGPYISISVFPSDSICAGDTVTFSAVTAWGGSTPTYNWKVNGVSGGAGSTFSYVPANGDTVLCLFTSTYTCMTAPTTPSDPIYMFVKNCNVGVGTTEKHFLRIYPNPANDRLCIVSDKGAYNSLVISNCVGQVMIRQQMHSGQEVVNVRSLPAGVYYLTLKGADGSVVKKFVKE